MQQGLQALQVQRAIQAIPELQELSAQLPQAVLALKQGAGRLIRDPEDFGVIMIGDPRVKTKAYGRAFLEALPPCPVTTDAALSARFLHERLALLRAG